MSGFRRPGIDETTLLDAIQRLSIQVELLTQVVDECRTELQWRNNQRADGRPRPPFMLNSMLTDPATLDLATNQAAPADLPQATRSSHSQFLFD